MFNFKIFRKKIYTIFVEFEYPADWPIKDWSDVMSETSECIAFWIYGPQNERRTCTTLLRVEVYQSPSWNIEESLEHEIARIRSHESILNKVREKSPDIIKMKEKIFVDRIIEVDGNKARELVAAQLITGNHNPGERSINRYVVFEKGLYSYELYFQAPENEDKKYVEIYERFLNTFRVMIDEDTPQVQV